jgi:uncharacterized protein (TIGR03118 family)
MTGKYLGSALFGALLAGASLAGAQQTTTYQQTNILSDGWVTATVTDPNFVDPWGISIGTDFWINTNVTGFSYVNNASGSIAFKATIPPAPGNGTTGSPTGTVFVSGAPSGSFALSNGQSASFLFSTLDGTISGWNSGSPNNVAEIEVNHWDSSAVYTDMALVTNTNGTYILAANFGAGGDVEVYDDSFAAASLTGSFTDPNIPAGYAPYAIHVIGSTVYVTYMLRNTTTYQETLGASTGIVDAFDMNGNFVKRAITGGKLNAPWGMALAPAGFGSYGGDLLVGNFGDGIINVYNPTTYAFVGQLTDSNGNVISNSGLWELVFGQASPSVGDPNTLYFSAGLDNETHGLFGSIAASAAAPAGTFALSSSASTLTVSSGGNTTATLTLAPSNGFSGSVALACSGLPSGVTCSFSPSTISLTGTASATTTLTIASAASTSPYTVAGGDKTGGKNPATRGGVGVGLAAMMPLSAFLLFGIARRRRLLSLLPMVLLGLVVCVGFAGCSSGSNTTPTPTPTPVTSQVTVTATSGTISQSTTISLTVQ